MQCNACMNRPLLKCTQQVKTEFIFLQSLVSYPDRSISKRKQSQSLQMQFKNKTHNQKENKNLPVAKIYFFHWICKNCDFDSCKIR